MQVGGVSDERFFSNSFPDRLSCCEMQWYVLSVKSNYEKQAEQNIQGMGAECFLPTVARTEG